MHEYWCAALKGEQYLCNCRRSSDIVVKDGRIRNTLEAMSMAEDKTNNYVAIRRGIAEKIQEFFREEGVDLGINGNNIEVRTWYSPDSEGPMGGRSSQVLAAVDLKEAGLYGVGINVYCEPSMLDRIEDKIEQDAQQDKMRARLGFTGLAGVLASEEDNDTNA